jgi:hypothetical protein
VGHRVKIHIITQVTGKERDDLEIKDYTVLKKSQEQSDDPPPHRTLIMDFTLTHTRSSMDDQIYTLWNNLHTQDVQVF